jgi:hypothetical protein
MRLTVISLLAAAAAFSLASCGESKPGAQGLGGPQDEAHDAQYGGGIVNDENRQIKIHPNRRTDSRASLL